MMTLFFHFTIYAGRRLSNFEVKLEDVPEGSASLCYRFNGEVAQGASTRIVCDEPVSGRYVVIRKYDPVAAPPNRILTLCEVRVFGMFSFHHFTQIIYQITFLSDFYL